MLKIIDKIMTIGGIIFLTFLGATSSSQLVKNFCIVMCFLNLLWLYFNRRKGE